MTCLQRTRRIPLLMGVVALSAGLAACGGGSDSSGASETRETGPTTVAPSPPPSVVDTDVTSPDRESDGDASATTERPDPGAPTTAPAGTRDPGDESDDTGDRRSEPAEPSASGPDNGRATTDTPALPAAVVPGPASPDTEPFTCGVSPVLATDWPFAVSEHLQIADLAVEGNRYAVAGITSDLDAVLSDSLSAFDGFDVVERESDRTSLLLDVTSDGVAVEIRIDDRDQDGCWNVEIVAAYDRRPPPVEQPVEESAAPAVRSDGNVLVMTPRGDFELEVSACRIAPAFVDASSSDGELRMRATSGDGVSVVWTYADGEVVADAAAEQLFVNEISRGVAIGDGTIFVEMAC